MNISTRSMPVSLLLWLLALLLVAWAYLPGLPGPMLLDDYENLRVLRQLDEHPQFSTDVILGNASGPLGRPVAMASFVYEYLYFDQGVAGQKRINLALHLCNGLLALLLAHQLLRAGGVRDPWLPAAIAGSLWVSAPLLLSTTLYVVQRMTLLASLFMLCGMLSYVRGRLAQPGRPAAFAWYLAALLFVGMAAFSKETGLLALPMMAAMELLIFGPGEEGPHRHRLKRLGIVFIALSAVLAIASSAWWLDWLSTSYARRDYTLYERVLTQARVLWDYIGQLLIPDIGRMGLYQDDVVISRGLTSPWSTLFGVLGWLLVLAAVAYGCVRRRWALPALGISLFLLGHAMESTVLPLELYFEHRNYLPSLGVWLALVAVGVHASTRWPALRGWLLMLAYLVVFRNLILLSSQAVVWSNPYLLHMDAANHHPDSQRSHLQLAQLYARDGHLDAALAAARTAWGLRPVGDFERAVTSAIFHCQAGVPMPDRLFSEVQLQSGELSGNDVSALTSRLVRLMIEDNCPATDAHWLADELSLVAAAAETPPASPRIVGALMLLDNHVENYERALARSLELQEREPDDVMALQFTLYLSDRLNLAESRAQALSALTRLRDSGRLNRQETYNMELFLDSQG